MMRALALSALLAACNADLHHTTDANAAVPDVPGDTLAPSTGDPTPSAVKLTVTRAGQPVAGVAVFFQNADSTLVAAALTNDDGLAWAEMSAGGFVTAVEHESSGIDELSTFAAVAPADALALDFAPTGPTTQTTFTLTFPDAGAPAYSIYTPCGSMAVPSTTVAYTVVGCDSAVDFIVLPLDAEGNPAGTSLYAPGVAIFGPTVTLTGPYEALAPTTFSYSNVPASWQFVGLYHAISAESRAYAQSNGTTPTGTAAVMQLEVPSTTASTLTVTTQHPASGEVGQQSIYDWSPASTSYALDLASAQLAPYATMPTYDPATRVVSWTERSGAQPDLVRARLHVYRDDIPTGRAWSWRLAAPRSETHVGYPQLPVLDFDFNPQTGDAIAIDELTTIQAPGGYAAFRAHAFGEPRRAVSGASGRLLTQTLFFPEP